MMQELAVWKSRKGKHWNMLGYPDKSSDLKPQTQSVLAISLASSKKTKSSSRMWRRDDNYARLIQLFCTSHVSPYFWDRSVGLPHKTDGVLMDTALFRQILQKYKPLYPSAAALSFRALVEKLGNGVLFTQWGFCGGRRLVDWLRFLSI